MAMAMANIPHPPAAHHPIKYGGAANEKRTARKRRHSGPFFVTPAVCLAGAETKDGNTQHRRVTYPTVTPAVF